METQFEFQQKQRRRFLVVRLAVYLVLAAGWIITIGTCRHEQENITQLNTEVGALNMKIVALKTQLQTKEAVK